MDPQQTPSQPLQPQGPQSQQTNPGMNQGSDGVGQQQPVAPAEQTQQIAQHQVVQVMRPVNPTAPEIPEHIQQKHEHSKKTYPNLNLSNGEFVIDSVRRHPIGILKIWAIVGSMIAAMVALAFFATNPIADMSPMVTGANASAVVSGVIVLLSVLFALGGVIATYVYNSNRFYLTNESVIQEIMPSLFSRHVQTVSLSNIEDASFRQEGILPHILNYGDIRLSTEGDETTYRFSYVANPSKHIDRLNNAVEAFKNGRPVTD